MKRSLILAGLLATACGAPEDRDSQRTPTAGERDTPADTLAGDTEIPISLEVTAGETEPTLALAEAFLIAQSFRIECDGIEPQATKENRFILIGERTNCLAKLVQFTLASGEIFVPKEPFKTFVAPDTAIFASGTRELRVEVLQQIPPTLRAAVTVQYRFTELRKGETRKIETNKASLAIEGALAPNFSLVRQDYDYQSFNLTFECGVPVSGRTLADAQCAGDNLATMRFIAEPLVANVELDFLSLELLDKLYAAPGPRMLAEMGATFLKPGEGGLKNGGFRLKSAPISAGTRNPKGLADAYLLVLSPKGVASYLATRLAFEFPK